MDTKERCKKYYQENKEKINMNHKQYYSKNKEKIKTSRKNQYYNDLKHQVYKKCCCRINKIIKDCGLKFKAQDLLGCDKEKLYNHLIQTLNINYNLYKLSVDYLDIKKFEIDHIIPVSKIKNIEQLNSICHYSNLQMLTITDHNKKHKNKWISNYQINISNQNLGK